MKSKLKHELQTIGGDKGFFADRALRDGGRNACTGRQVGGVGGGGGGGKGGGGTSGHFITKTRTLIIF